MSHETKSTCVQVGEHDAPICSATGDAVLDGIYLSATGLATHNAFLHVKTPMTDENR